MEADPPFEMAERPPPCRHIGDGTTFGEVKVNGVRIDPVSPERFKARIDEFLACGRSHVVHFIPADPTVLAMTDPTYRATLNAGDLNVADGMSVVWALRLKGQRSARITGTDGFRLLFPHTSARGFGHFLYGGTPETLALLEARLTSMDPSAHVTAESPPFRDLDDGELLESVERIRRSGASLVWVGLGTPKQDIVAERLRALEAASVILCVGAAFDFIAGTKPRAPRWMQRSGLEWLHRLVSEPRRLWRRYLFENPRFIMGVTKEYLEDRR